MEHIKLSSQRSKCNTKFELKFKSMNVSAAGVFYEKAVSRRERTRMILKAQSATKCIALRRKTHGTCGSGAASLVYEDCNKVYGRQEESISLPKTKFSKQTSSDAVDSMGTKTNMGSRSFDTASYKLGFSDAVVLSSMSSKARHQAALQNDMKHKNKKGLSDTPSLRSYVKKIRQGPFSTSCAKNIDDDRKIPLLSLSEKATMGLLVYADTETSRTSSISNMLYSPSISSKISKLRGAVSNNGQPRQHSGSYFLTSSSDSQIIDTSNLPTFGEVTSSQSKYKGLSLETSKTDLTCSVSTNIQNKICSTSTRKQITLNQQCVDNTSALNSKVNVGKYPPNRLQDVNLVLPLQMSHEKDTIKLQLQSSGLMLELPTNERVSPAHNKKICPYSATSLSSKTNGKYNNYLQKEYRRDDLKLEQSVGGETDMNREIRTRVCHNYSSEVQHRLNFKQFNTTSQNVLDNDNNVSNKSTKIEQQAYLSKSILDHTVRKRKRNFEVTHQVKREHQNMKPSKVLLIKSKQTVFFGCDLNTELYTSSNDKMLMSQVPSSTKHYQHLVKRESAEDLLLSADV